MTWLERQIEYAAKCRELSAEWIKLADEAQDPDAKSFALTCATNNLESARETENKLQALQL